LLKMGIDWISGYVTPGQQRPHGRVFWVRAGPLSRRVVAFMNGQVRPRAMASPDELAEPLVLAAFRVDRRPSGSLCIRTIHCP